MSVLGSVINAGTGEPMKGVSFTFVAEANGMKKSAGSEMASPIVKKSANKGRFRTTLPENNYKVMVEKIGFQKQELTITVANGETTNLDIELSKS